MRVPLAVLAVSTANDFARALGLPLELEQACALARDPAKVTRHAELALAAAQPFVNAAAPLQCRVLCDGRECYAGLCGRLSSLQRARSAPAARSAERHPSLVSTSDSTARAAFLILDREVCGEGRGLCPEVPGRAERRLTG